MRNCWIWSVCLVLGGALSANAALIVGNNQPATTLQGNINLTYNVVDGGTYYNVIVKIASITGAFTGASIKGIEGRYTANSGKLYTAVGDPHDMTLVEDPNTFAMEYAGNMWTKETTTGRTIVSPPSSIITYANALGASTLSNPADTNSPPIAINNNFGRTDPTTRTTDYLEGTWSSLTGTPWSVGSTIASLYVTKSTENITFSPDAFTGVSKLGYTNGNTDPTEFRLGTVVVVPEPGTMAMLLTGGLALAGFGWRRRK